jgi:hypothetical protein
MGGHVFTNVSQGHAWRGTVRLENSGVYIPDEMLQGASTAAFDGIVGSELEAQVSYEIGLLKSISGL